MEEKILELLSLKKFGDLKALLSQENPADIVEFFEVIPKQEWLLVFRILPKELAAEVFAYLDGNTKAFD